MPTLPRLTRYWKLLTWTSLAVGLGSVGALSAVARQQDWADTPQGGFLESEIVQTYQCTTCHTIAERGGTVGPNLNHVGLRRTRDWLHEWLVDPQLVKPGTRMPQFDFTPSQIEAAVNHLSGMTKELHTREILDRGLGPEETGELLLEDYDCLGCHRLGSAGRFIAPDLTWIGLRKTQEWEAIWLADPPAFKPGTFMPNLNIPADGIDALTAFLHSLQGQRNEESLEWEFRTNFFLGNSDRERGELVFRRFGCWSCHGESGVGGIRNPNMAPDELMPSLRQSTVKYTPEQFLERLRERVYPEALEASGPEPPFFCPDYGKYMEAAEFSDLYAYLKTFAPRQRKFRFK